MVKLSKYKIPGLSIHEGIRSDSRLYVYHGFVYKMSKVRDNTAYLTCRRTTCGGCAVAYRYKNKPGTFNCTKCHTHEEESKFIRCLEFRRQLRVDCMRDTVTPFKQLFDAVGERMGGVPEGIVFRSIVTSMNRARRRSKENPNLINFDEVDEGDEDSDEKEEDIKNEVTLDDMLDSERNEQETTVIEEMPECTVDLENIKIETEYVMEDSNCQEIEHDTEFEINNDDSQSEEEENISSEKRDQNNPIDLRDCKIMGCELIDGLLSTCGSQVIIYDNFIYIVDKMTEDIIYLKCFKQTCCGTGVVFLNEKLEGIVKLKESHNHPCSNITVKLSEKNDNKERKRRYKKSPPVASRYKKTKVSIENEIQAGPSSNIKKEFPTKKQRLLNYNSSEEDECSDNDLTYEDPVDDEDYNVEKDLGVTKTRFRSDTCNSNAEFLKTCKLPGVTVHDNYGSLLICHDNYYYRINKRRGFNFYLTCRSQGCGVSATLKIENKEGKINVRAREHNHEPQDDLLLKMKNKLPSRLTLTPKNSRHLKEDGSKKIKSIKTEPFCDDYDEEDDNENDITISSAQRLKNIHLPGIDVLEGLRVNSFILCYKDFSYRVKNRRNDSYYLECRLPKCGATATIKVQGNEGSISNIGSHKHENDIDYIKAIKFRKELRDEVRKCPGIPARLILEKVLARYGGEENFDLSAYRKPTSILTRGSHDKSAKSDDDEDDVSVHDISHTEEVVGEYTPDNDDLEDLNDCLPCSYQSLSEFLKTCELPGMEIIEGLRQNSLIFTHDNYTYRIKNRRRLTLYLICRLESCGTSAVLAIKDQVGKFTRGSRDHNHAPDIEYINMTSFKADLRAETKSSPGTPGRQIYNTVITRHPGIKLKYKEVEAIIFRAKHYKEKKKLSYSKIAEEALADDNNVSKLDDTDFYESYDEADCIDDDVLGTNYYKTDGEQDDDRPQGCDNFSFLGVPYKVIAGYVPGIEFFIGFRSNAQVFTYDNFAYTVSKARHRALHLRCRNKSCHGTASITKRDDDGEFIFKVNQQHNHGSEERYINTLKFRQDLRKETLNHSNLSNRDIFNRVSKSHQNAKRGNVNYSSIQSLLTRLRKKIDQQPTVKNLNDLAQALLTPEWSSFGESYHVPEPQPWYRGVHVAPDGTKIGAFLNDWMVRNIKNLDPIILHIDVSYACRPEVFKNHHVLISHIVFYNKVFAFGFFIISRKSSIGYRKCFELIQEYTGVLEPKTVLSDYEPALHAAIRIFWPQCNIMGCYYHFVQSIVRNALECDRFFLRDPIKRRIVKHYLSMPLIPPEYISNGHVIINKVIKDENLEVDFCILDDFFGQYWMESIGPETFSTYGITNTFNDSVDIFYQKLKHCASARTSAWSFIDSLRGLSHNEEADFIEGLESHDKIVGQLVVQKKQEKEILKAQKELIRTLEGTSRKKMISDHETLIESAIATFLIRMSDVLDVMLEREAQEPKQSRLIRPKRKLISSNTDMIDTNTAQVCIEQSNDEMEQSTGPLEQNDLIEVLNNMAEQIYVVQDEEGNIISYVKPEPKSPEGSPEEDEETALVDHDYYVEIVCDAADHNQPD